MWSTSAIYSLAFLGTFGLTSSSFQVRVKKQEVKFMLEMMSCKFVARASSSVVVGVRKARMNKFLEL